MVLQNAINKGSATAAFTSAALNCTTLTASSTASCTTLTASSTASCTALTASTSAKSPTVSDGFQSQSLLRGAFDGSRNPSALSISAGLSVLLTATVTNYTVCFGAGFDQYGLVNFVGNRSTNLTFSSLTANSTLYLYIDRNTGTGALTAGFSALRPTSGIYAPASPATDQHWFDELTNTMNRWNGSAWINTFQRVFVGECVTGASTVTTVTNYPYTPLITVPSYTLTPSVLVTRPANTTPYAVGQAIANATSGAAVWTIPGCARTIGGSGRIFRARLISNQNPTLKLVAEILLFNVAPTAINDGATVNTALGTSHQGTIPIAANSTTSVATNYETTGLNIGFITSGSTSLFALVKCLNAYVPPVNSETFTLILDIAPD